VVKKYRKVVLCCKKIDKKSLIYCRWESWDTDAVELRIVNKGTRMRRTAKFSGDGSAPIPTPYTPSWPWPLALAPLPFEKNPVGAHAVSVG